MLKKIMVLAALLGMILSWPAIARVHQYGASAHESSWSYNGTAVYCRLVHDIPGYGTAIFSQSVDKELAFSVTVKRTPRTEKMSASLQVMAPSWKHGAGIHDLGKVPITKSARPFLLGRDMARRLFLELEDGMFPVFSYLDWADEQNSVNVAISAVNFRQARESFLQCLASLLPYGFKDIRNTRLYFEFDKSQLSKKAMARLDKLAMYIKNSPDDIAIDIDGHTDAKGFRRYNQKLSLERANAVRNYLKKQGITEAAMQVRGFGEKKPAKSNRTRQGRALNRRVVISLAK